MHTHMHAIMFYVRKKGEGVTTAEQVKIAIVWVRSCHVIVAWSFVV